MIEIDSILEVVNHIDDVDVVIFDLDDTLYGEKQYIRSGYKKIAETFGISEIEDKMWNVFMSGGKAIDEVLAEYDMIDKKDEALTVYRFQEPDIDYYPGVYDMLLDIKEIKLLGVITDGRVEGQTAKIKALKLDEVADNIIITDSLGGAEFRKPNEAAFVKMQEYFDVSYSDMVYIGDNINKDFIAPDRLGMKSIWFKNIDGIYYR